MPWIKSKMYPLRDDVKPDKLQEAFEWLRNRKMIIVYSFSGHEYFYIPTWKEHQSGTQKEAKSSLPSPELVRSNSGVIPEAAEVPASASVIESELDSESETVDPIIELTTLYENEIGMITPFSKDMLIDAANEFPVAWFKPAFEEAVKHEARNWKYIETILRRWKSQGFKSNKKPEKKSNGDVTQELINKKLAELGEENGNRP